MKRTAFIAAFCAAAFLPHHIAGGGDILRGGAKAGQNRSGETPGAAVTAAQTARAMAAHQDALARTNRALTDANAMQNAARAAAAASMANNLGPDPTNPGFNLPDVPDGLTAGGLKVLTGGVWRGADSPVQSGGANGVNVRIKQREAQALLDWETFNIGRRTTLQFDQSAGGIERGRWIAFNRINDPSGRPSQILGSIKADGQVYVINPNGVIFGATSQVNARGLTVSSLSINENLLERGVVNLETNNAEFLFSNIPQGSWVPPASTTPDGLPGNIIIRRGAQIVTDNSPDGSGGRVVLVGRNVTNEGKISTPSGQTILAAGLQVGLAAHPSTDPTLRGLDVYVGDVGTGGAATNSGIIDVSTGNVTMAGKTITHSGVISAQTTVSLNGRIDLQASYDSIANRDFNPSTSGLPFLSRSSGEVLLGENSVMRIVPDYSSPLTTVGRQLPLKSLANITAQNVHLASGSLLFAPNADVSIRAGQWAPVNLVAGADGVTRGVRTGTQFAFTTGRVHIDQRANIHVAGTPGAFAPQANNIFEVQLRGNELAVSPLQRSSAVRGLSLVVDFRRSGVFNGRFWVGTPLGDTTGFVDIVQRDAAQLTAEGGSVTIQAGQSFVAQPGSIIDVSGGYFNNEGGRVQTSRLLSNGRLIDIAAAFPDRVYDGIYTGESTFSSARWGISETYANALAPLGAYTEPDYVEGAAGGRLQITAPAMVLDGDLRGATVVGPRQLRDSAFTSNMPGMSSLRISFLNDRQINFGNIVNFFTEAPTPPRITFGATVPAPRAADYDLTNLVPIEPGRQEALFLPQNYFALTGFGSIEIDNSEGEFIVPGGKFIELPIAGSLLVSSRNISIGSSISAPGGSLTFIATNLNRFQVAIDAALNPLVPPRITNPQDGSITLGSGARLSVAGLTVDERMGAAGADSMLPFQTSGGTIRLAGYNVSLEPGSELDVSGGVGVNFRGGLRYGNAGAIAVEAGQDLNFPSVLGGKLVLQGQLSGFAGLGASGGELSLKAPFIQVGGAQLHPDSLVLTPAFFSRGGFRTFNLTGIGARDLAATPDADGPVPFIPAVFIAPGVTIAPTMESRLYVPVTSAGRPMGWEPISRPIGERGPVSVGLFAGTIRNDFLDPATLEAPGRLVVSRGDIVISEGARLALEPGGNVTVRGSTVTMLGSIIAPGGNVVVAGASSFPLDSLAAEVATAARPTVYIGSRALISTSGTSFTVPDNYGRNIGFILPGGNISVSGNIVAERGALLSVSGTSAVFDIHPAFLGLNMDNKIPVTSGLLEKPYKLRTVAFRQDSNGGSISLAGSQMLYSDATLVGRPGGPTATGGYLAVSSGRFNAPGSSFSSADINFVVTQNGQALTGSTERGIGRILRDESNAVITGSGVFAVDRFMSGGFDSLDLGFNFNSTASPLTFGGNVRFEGDISLTARGLLRIAGGGIIQADGSVSLSAPYIALGQAFAPPLNPRDANIPFRRFEAGSGRTPQDFVAPTFGTGDLQISARLIDVGNLVLRSIGTASLTARNGEIRGNGTFNMAGDLTLTAAQIYPTTSARFDIFAYDHAGGTGSVRILRSGIVGAPLSAGGSLGIYADEIRHGGTLLAPFGSIVLGWDGEDTDLSTPAIDPPRNVITGTALPIPVASQIILESGSVTSVAGIDYFTGRPLLVPFGLSPDGLNIISPSATNVTASGLPIKSIKVGGTNVVTEAGSVLDIRGGGDLLAFRFIAGSGGPTDILGTAGVTWSSGGSYTAGTLVNFGGRTFSARVAINPSAFAGGAGPTPGSNRFWTPVADSYAVIPGYNAGFAPFGAFNRGPLAVDLGGDPGFVGTNLRIGDRVFIDGAPGLRAGNYTLLPRRYAILPGAFLVTPQSSGPMGIYTTDEGATFTTGYRFNGFNTSRQTPSLRQLFEVAPGEVVAGRAEYEISGLTQFLRDAAVRLDLPQSQRLPVDAGALVIHGNTGLNLLGDVLAGAAASGRGATIDLSSFADIAIIGDAQTHPGTAVLRASVLSRFGADSLLIGGIRRTTEAGTNILTRTQNVVLDNAGTPLSGPDIALTSRTSITLANGAELSSTGTLSTAVDRFLLQGNGVLVRVSADPSAGITRSGVTSSPTPLLTVGSGARIISPGTILDSTYGFSLHPTAVITSQSVTFGAGQIGIQLAGVVPLTGQVDLTRPQLAIGGETLAALQNVLTLRFLAYQSSIDIYGPGTLGTGSTREIDFQSGTLRGFNQGAGASIFNAGLIRFGNNAAVAAVAPVGPQTGSLVMNTNRIVVGAGQVRVEQYSTLDLNATGGLLFEGVGGLTATGDVRVVAPVVVASQRAEQSLTALGNLTLLRGNGFSTAGGGLGALLTLRGASVVAESNVLLPSGLLEVRATGAGGDVTIGGLLDVSGISRQFYDVTRYTDAGEIFLVSDLGDVTLLDGSRVSVDAPAGGGNAGTVRVRASAGEFASLGSFEGSASDGRRGGSFILDTLELASLGQLRDTLTAGGFTESWNIRVRTSDLVVSGVNRVNEYILSADAGSILVNGTIDASGRKGGSIALIARNDLTLASGAILTTAAQNFSSAGKGGTIYLEAGASTGGTTGAGSLSILDGALIDLSVSDVVAGDFLTPGSSAFLGQFTGTLHLRAPQINGNTDVAINKIEGSILGASSVLVEGYRIYTPAGGVMNTTLRNLINADGDAFVTPNEAAISNKLLGGTVNAGLDPIFVIAPGTEIVNLAGDLTLGMANPTGNSNAEARTTADWDLSGFRYGAKRAPGVLTLRASGNLVFNNTLSDGFAPIAGTAANGHSTMWLATPQAIDLDGGGNLLRPINLQHWSYRLTAGADLGSANVMSVRPIQTLAPNQGSILVGEFYPVIPNPSTFGQAPGAGQAGLTANTIRISANNNDFGTRFEVIRTGTGNIDLNAGLDVQLRNQFATIYTSGVALPERDRIFQNGDFSRPAIMQSGQIQHPNPGALGEEARRRYDAYYTMAGGNIGLAAGRDIGRFTLYNGQVIADTSRQLPTNWLHRRGFVDETGAFGVGYAGPGGNDPSASTTWWINFSNFFQGIGALGGGDITMLAGRDVINADAVIPTNARMAGIDPISGLSIAPNAENLLEHGGGNLVVQAGRNVSGGSFYVERGFGEVFAGAEISTNSARTISRGILAGAVPQVLDPVAWLPTIFYVGKSRFDIAARSDVLTGQVTNPFLLPQGAGNKFWYKTQFNTFGENAGAEFRSFGGSVTHRLSITLPGDSTVQPVLFYAIQTHNLINPFSAANFQPWLRLSELAITPFQTQLALNAPNISSTGFSGDINVIGSMLLYPSPVGSLQLLASDSVQGLQRTGVTTAPVEGGIATVTAHSAALINVSDTNPATLPGVASPSAFASLVGTSPSTQLTSNANPLAGINSRFNETGSFAGLDASISRKLELHTPGILHRNNPEPVRIYGLGGDVTGITLFSPTQTQVIADRDITDVAFYLQNSSADGITIVSAGRDIIPFNENSPTRVIAADINRRNIVVDQPQALAGGGNTRALAGDIQIGGQGVLEVLAGRNLDLGTGANFLDGRGTGITSIGRSRNPFLPIDGARIIAMAGVGGANGGAAIGLAGSILDFDSFIAEFITGGVGFALKPDLQEKVDEFETLTAEQQAIVALDVYFAVLQQSASEFGETGSYATGFAAQDALLGNTNFTGDVFTRTRDIRTTSNGSISMLVPGGDITMAPSIIGNPLTPPGIVTEAGGAIQIYLDGSLNIGQARVFTLRGGDIIIWSASGDIAAGSAPKTVVSAPPTRVSIDSTSGELITDLGGLATGGGIGVLASVEGVEPGGVALVAPEGTVDAGDAGIRATGDISIAASVVLNADNITVGGTSTGVPAAPSVAAPSLGGLSSAASTTAATTGAAEDAGRQDVGQQEAPQETPSIISVEVLGYGGVAEEDEDEEERRRRALREGNPATQVGE